MKKLAIAFVIFLGLGTSAVAQQAKQVKDETTFRKLVVDKKWTNAWGNTVFEIKNNGIWGGKSAKSGKIKGTWYWKGKTWCREGTLGKTNLKKECIKFYMIGNRILKSVNKSNPKGNYNFLR